MKYNLSNIMKRAWQIKRENADNIFALCLKIAWVEAKALENMTAESFVETMVNAGANRWQRGNHDRLYIRNAGSVFGFVINGTYKSSGRISGATLDGETISNSYATEIYNDLDGMYIDLNTMKLFRSRYARRTCIADRVNELLERIA